jgi:hypothetical protein
MTGLPLLTPYVSVAAVSVTRCALGGRSLTRRDPRPAPRRQQLARPARTRRQRERAIRADRSRSPRRDAADAAGRVERWRPDGAARGGRVRAAAVGHGPQGRRAPKQVAGGFARRGTLGGGGSGIESAGVSEGDFPPERQGLDGLSCVDHEAFVDGAADSFHERIRTVPATRSTRMRSRASRGISSPTFDVYSLRFPNKSRQSSSQTLGIYNNSYSLRFGKRCRFGQGLSQTLGI